MGNQDKWVEGAALQLLWEPGDPPGWGCTVSAEGALYGDSQITGTWRATAHIAGLCASSTYPVDEEGSMQ